MGHGEGVAEMPRSGDHVPRQRHEMVRVIDPRCAPLHHLVVTGPLTLEYEPIDGVPDQGVVPVDGASQLAYDVRQCVSPPNVSQLMRENDSKACIRPRIRSGRQHDGRPKDPEGDGGPHPAAR